MWKVGLLIGFSEICLGSGLVFCLRPGSTFIYVGYATHVYSVLIYSDLTP
jgi:hypothetical protein